MEQFIYCHLQRIHPVRFSAFPAAHPVSVHYSTWTSTRVANGTQSHFLHFSSNYSLILLLLRCCISDGRPEWFLSIKFTVAAFYIEMRRLQSFDLLIGHEPFPAKWLTAVITRLSDFPWHTDDRQRNAVDDVSGFFVGSIMTNWRTTTTNDLLVTQLIN